MGPRCQAELIAIGSEILLGQINNSHAQHISREMAKEGFFVYHHSAVGDNLRRIISAYELASKRSNVVIVTGGLGADGGRPDEGGARRVSGTSAAHVGVGASRFGGVLFSA